MQNDSRITLMKKWIRQWRDMSSDIKKLDAAEADARKRLVYFSCLKGEVLKRLKEITGKKMSQLLKLTNYSQMHAYFLINLYELVNNYIKLMYSDLPNRFFKSNLKEIESICESEETFSFDLWCVRDNKIFSPAQMKFFSLHSSLM